jgi:hypothetical protein
MEEISENSGRTSSHAKLIVGFIIVMFLLAFIPPIVQSPIFRPSYHGTVTISPVESEFNLNMDFYPSAGDANAGTNNFMGYGWGVDPSDEEQRLGFTVSISIYSDSVWAKIYFDEILENPSTLCCLRVGQMVHTFLLDVEFSIYIEPN